MTRLSHDILFTTTTSTVSEDDRADVAGIKKVDLATRENPEGVVEH